jgi:hypothetical protein
MTYHFARGIEEQADARKLWHGEQDPTAVKTLMMHVSYAIRNT